MTEAENTFPTEELHAKMERGIPQQRIKELLIEASTLAASKTSNNEQQVARRLAGIQLELLEGGDLDNPDQTINSAEGLVQNEGIAMLANYLFTEAVQNSPESVPTLFPVFAAISGSREGSGFAKVDWSIAKQPSPQQAIGEVKRMLGPNSPNASPQRPSGTSLQGGR